MPMITQKVIRRAAYYGVALVCGIIIVPVASTFFIKLARECGLYDSPSGTLESAMRFLYDLMFSSAFIAVAGLILGFAGGVWIHHFVGRYESAGAREENARIRQDAISKQDMIVRWHTMLADIAMNLGDEDADIRRMLLANAEYLSLERYLAEDVKRLIRTGTFDYDRTIVLLSADEERMTYDERVLFHLSNEIARIEREWKET